MARKGGLDRGICQRKGRDGWWVRLSHNGRERWHRCDTKSQAKALYGRLKAELREGTYFPDRFKRSPEITLRAWIARYRANLTSPGLRNMNHYGTFWSHWIGHRLLTEVTADELRHIQARMLEQRTRTPQTINRYFAALRRILNLALAEGKIPTNPVKGVTFFREPQGRLRFLSEPEIASLRKQMAAAQWPLVAFALETGVRLSEQFHARWECVDLERGILTIPRSKSGRTRHVVLSEAALRLLRDLPSRMQSSYVFPSPRHAGQPMQGRHFVVTAYEPALAAAGIEGVTWHTLRHTFASRAVMAGVDIRTVQELMGHSTITMTMRYAHLSPAHLRAAVNKASLGSSMPQHQTGTVTKTVTTPDEPITTDEGAMTEAVVVAGGEGWRRRAGSNRRIAVLQNAALPLIGPGDPALSPSGNRLASAIREANRAIYHDATRRPEWAGMGTTVVAVLLTDRGMSFAHVGDSRLYLVHGHTIRQLTADHSWVAEQVRSGLMTEAEAERSPQRNMVTRALGIAPTVDVATGDAELHPGDLLLLCSDGLTKGVTANTLLTVLTQTDDVTAATRQLITLANRAGGEDNITVITLALHDAMEHPVRYPVAM